ncbi:MAG: hypothetical protein Q7U28_06830 [Aquabacterium sp.]|nr:hypothetical protein [Aquabacterium sp.]
MTETATVAPEQSVKRIGWGLTALALVTPALMGAAGILSAFKVGEITVQVGFAWVATAVVIDLLTKKRDALVKANGRIVAAVLALVMALVSGFNVYRDTQKVDSAKKELIEQFMQTSIAAKAAPAEELAQVAQPAATQQPVPATPVAQQAAATSDADKTVGFLSAMKVRAKQFAEESAAIDRKFNAVDLGTVLTAQNLVNKASLDASRKKLNSYKAAIAERDAMLKKHLTLSEQIIRGSGLSEREVNEGLAGLNSSKGTVQKNYADLTIAQMASVKATENILDFAQKGLGRITVQNGQAMFQTQPELDEYSRLIQVLTDAAGAETAITEKVQAQAQRSKQDLSDQLK